MLSIAVAAWRTDTMIASSCPECGEAPEVRSELFRAVVTFSSYCLQRDMLAFDDRYTPHVRPFQRRSKRTWAYLPGDSSGVSLPDGYLSGS